MEEPHLDVSLDQVLLITEVVVEDKPGAAHEGSHQGVEGDCGPGIGPVTLPQGMGYHRGGKGQEHGGEQDPYVGPTEPPVQVADTAKGGVVVEPEDVPTPVGFR